MTTAARIYGKLHVLPERGPAVAVGAGLDADTVAATVQQGRSVMPAGIVSGREQADAVAYVVSISSRSG